MSVVQATDQWISAPEIFDGVTLHRDHALRINDGRVAGIAAVSSVTGKPTHVDGLLLAGFFDIQVNGGGGALLNTNPTVDGVRTILAAHRALGTVAVLPTVITDHPDVTDAAAKACLAARDMPGMMGLHIEGPHLSHARRGTHRTDMLRPMDETTMGLLRYLRDADLPVLITVAPEAVTPAQVSALVAMGVVVSVGHSDATAAQAQALVAAGATCFTHLFNAMSPMQHRAPGVTGAAIASDVWCSIIADGIHVDPLMVALACRARPVAHRMIAVSDAMATVGGPDHFRLYGQEIHLQDGRLVNAEGALAGAHLIMADAVRNLVAFGVPQGDALRMGRTNPAELMGLTQRLALVGTDVRDLIVLDRDLRLQQVGCAVQE